MLVLKWWKLILAMADMRVAVTAKTIPKGVLNALSVNGQMKVSIIAAKAIISNIKSGGGNVTPGPRSCSELVFLGILKILTESSKTCCTIGYTK